MPPGLFIYFTLKTTDDTPYIVPIDTFIAVFMMSRFYILLRLFQNSTQYTNIQSYRICQMNGFVPDSYFAIKCYMKTSAMQFLAIGSASTILLFGLIIKMFEQ